MWRRWGLSPYRVPFHLHHPLAHPRRDAVHHHPIGTDLDDHIVFNGFQAKTPEEPEARVLLLSLLG